MNIHTPRGPEKHTTFVLTACIDMPVFRLPQNVVPVRYNLELALDVQQTEYSGTVHIRVTIAKPTRVVLLHGGQRLAIPSATACASGDPRDEPTHAKIDRPPAETIDGRECIVRLTFTRSLVGSVLLSLTFRAPYSLTACGMYVSTWKGIRTLATQMQATSARDVFPCFDEPALKAVFQVTVRATVPNADLLPWRVLSNMPVLSVTDDTTYVFEPTPPMSTYLLAVVIAPLIPRSVRSPTDVAVTVWCYPGDEHLTGLPLRFATACLQDLTAIFNIPYPLSKLDLVPVYDFDAGAMENWGLITFRPALLYADAATPQDDVYDVYVTIAHELAHQWFGNLVTMAWWDEIWLNESFATFTAAWTCSRVFRADTTYGFTEEDAWIAFVCTEMCEALELDALPSTKAIVPDAAFITTSADVEQLFDSKAYAKGAVVLRMLACVLGLDVFARGLTAYLTVRSARGGVATSTHLWDALTRVSGMDVRAFMTPWLYTRGFPVVRVSGSGNVVQAPFLRADGAVAAPTQWPLAVRTSALATSTVLPYPYTTHVVSCAALYPVVQGAAFKVLHEADRVYPGLYFNTGFVVPAVHGDDSAVAVFAAASCASDDMLGVSLTQLSKVLSVKIRVQHGLDVPSFTSVTFIEGVARDGFIHDRVRGVAADVLEEWKGICLSCDGGDMDGQPSDGTDNDEEYAKLKADAVHGGAAALRALAAFGDAARLIQTLTWAALQDGGAVRPTEFVYLFTAASSAGHITARDTWLRTHWHAVAALQGKHGMEQIVSVVLRPVRTSAAYTAWRRFFALPSTQLHGYRAAVEEALQEAAARVFETRQVRTHVCTPLMIG